MKNLLLLLILVSTHLQAAESDAEKSVPHSSFAAEQQYKTILETNDKLNLEISQLVTLNSRVSKASECLEKNSLDKQAAQASIDKIKSNFQKLKNASPSEELNNNSASYREFDAAYYAVFFNSINPVESCVDSLSFLVKDGSFGQLGPIVVDDIIEALQRKKNSDATSSQYIQNFFPAPPIDTKFEHLEGLVQFTKHTYGTNLKRSDLQPDLIEGANKDIDALSVESVSERFDQTKDSLKKFVLAISLQIKADIDNKRGLILSNNKMLSSLDQTMSEQKAQQTALDQRLIYSVWGMIAALVVLFVSVGFFRESIAERMIENRSLVEVMSMAFILLTIIILGTGGKIGNEALGALLGTIAGYIFGRKAYDEKQGK